MSHCRQTQVPRTCRSTVNTPGGVIQLLGDVLADPLESASAGTRRGVRFVGDHPPRPFGRQRLAARFPWLGRGSLGRGLQGVQFGFNGGQVRQGGLLEQMPLLRREAFRAGRETPAPVQGQFMSQLLDLDLTGHQLPFLDPHLSQQVRGQRPKLVGGQSVEGGRIEHGPRMPRPAGGRYGGPRKTAVLAVFLLAKLKRGLSLAYIFNRLGD